MKKILLFLFCLFVLQLTAQDLYDLNTIQNIEITFSQSNWDQLLDTEKAGNDGYVMAQSVSINGEVYDSVGVKYKGNSTYNPNQAKNPFHIELDTYKEHDHQGYTDIKLSNVAKDPSFLREVLSYQILRQYMDAPLSNYANISVNGTLIGLYSNSESISKKFVNSRFYSKSNSFFKCSPPGGAGPGSNDFPNLVYLGQDSTDYYNSYEIKSDDSWQDLINLTDVLANDVSNIESILDVDRVLWMLAFDNTFVNLDSYIGRFIQNYYLYLDDNQRFVPVVWDLNESFGRFSDTGSGNLTSTAAKQQMSHLLHENDADYPLVKQLLSNPTYKRMYIAHLKTMLLENFDNDTYATTGQSLQTLIDAAVQADNNKFFTYNNFIDNLNSDITGGGPGPGGGATPGITNLMDGRNTYLLNLADFTATAPSISNILVSTPTPIINESVTITADVSDENTAMLGYRSDVKSVFQKVQMYDDGAHNDGAANDGTYGVDIVIDAAYIQYYIYAENDNAGMFSPQRAEHEFHTLTATISNPTVGDLVINEFMASNDATIADQDGEYDDWIELYNNNSTQISLDGYFLSDDADDLMKWQFPNNIVIEGNGYLIIWADNDEDQTGLHANFKLSAAAESIFLVNAAGEIVDEVSYVDQTTDISYGRYPNGIGNFQSMNPTFNGENMGSTSSETLTSAISLKAIPNPANQSFYLEIENPNNASSEVLIYNLDGKQVYQNQFYRNENIDVSTWNTGVYIVRVGSSILKMVVI